MSDDYDEERTTRSAQLIVGLRPRPRRAHLLELVRGEGGPSRVELNQEAVVFGRGDEADVSLQSEEISREHARIVRVDDEYQLEDLDSRNGVFLNGLKVHLAILREGDEVQLGDIVYLYREGT